MAQINLYPRTQSETKISIQPNQLDANIEDYMLANLKAKVEGKSIDTGIVLKVLRIIDYDYGILDKSNFMGITVYNVKYECFMCCPTVNLVIICKVKSIFKGFLISKNGPVVAAVQFNKINPQKFEINNSNIIRKKTKEPIKIDDYIKVSIDAVTINLGEKEIVTVCKLLDMANENEKKSFEEDQLLAIDGSIDDDKEFI